MSTRLALAHQQAQARLAEQLSIATLAQWRMLVRAPGVGGDQFIERAVPAIQLQSTRSLALARVFYSNVRYIERRDAGPVPALPEIELPDEAVVTSLVAAGFKQLSDSLAAGRELEEALDIAGRSASGAAVRQTLAPGRQFVQRAPEHDSVAIGLYWTTSGDERVCHWCSMLESRGAVFRGNSWKTAEDPRPDGSRKVSAHDLCQCSLTPLFREDQSLPDSVEQRSFQWKLATEAHIGHDKVKAWRRYWMALQRGESEILALARAHGDKDAVTRLGVASEPSEREEVA